MSNTVTAKGTEIWDSRTLVCHIFDTFDLIVFRVIFGQSMRFSSNHFTPKRPDTGLKGMKCGING